MADDDLPARLPEGEPSGEASMSTAAPFGRRQPSEQSLRRNQHDLPARLVAAYPELRRFAAVVGPADVEPDDLVQDAFVRVLRRGAEGIDHLESYLRRTVLNLSANERRRWVRRQAAYRRDTPAVEMTASTFVDAADLLRLAPEVRAVLWLVEVEGWSYRQAGAVVGCSEEAARARASRGRRDLRAALMEEGT